MPMDLEALSLLAATHQSFLAQFEPWFRSRRREARQHLGHLKDGHCFLDIWEVYSSSAEPIGPKLICSVRRSGELATALEGLRKPLPGAIRIYIDEMYADNIFSSHMAQKYRVQAHRPASAGFQALAAQCKGHAEESWMQLRGYGFIPNGTTIGPTGDDPWTLSAEGSKPSPKTDEVLPSWLSSMDTWAEMERRIHLGETKDGDKFVLISCASFATTVSLRFFSRSLNPFVLTGQFSAKMSQLISTFQNMSFEDNVWKHFMLLQYYHANLDMFMDFLEHLKLAYIEPQAKDFDARFVKLRDWNMRELTRDAYFYQQLTEVGHAITSQTEYLLDIAQISHNGETSDTSGAAQRKVAELELRGHVRDVNAQLARLSESLKLHIEFLRLARDTSQTSSVNNLTILATIFLPMSLATGLLAMSKRFNELGGLLYDFFGVLMLVLIFIAIFFAVVAVVSFLVSSAGIERARQYKGTSMRAKVYSILLGLVTGLLIVASFLVGMFMDVVTGAKILGFGLAALLGCLLVFVVVVRPIFRANKRRKVKE